MPTEDLPPYPQLPAPLAEKLNPYLIFCEIRDYISGFEELFPYINLDVLREQTTAVRRKQVDAETQIRQFLIAFRLTQIFKDAFSLLDQESQKRIRAFPEGKSAQEVTRGDFELPPSPAAKHHVRILNTLHSLFHHDKKHSSKLDQEPASVKGPLTAPVIFENDKYKRFMKGEKVTMRGFNVDVIGNHQTVVDKEQLRAAAGCFGLMGIVTHMTFELAAMTHATLRPKKMPISLAMPPLWVSEVPWALYKHWTEKDTADAKADFEKRATEDYYAEWFCARYEFEMRLPALHSDPSEPDLSIVQRVWWDVIKLVHAEAKNARSPMCLTLELGIMGGSDMAMAPQGSTDGGTASIKVLTVPNAVPEEGEEFERKVANVWTGYEVDSAKLKIRPHWAKEWQGLKVSDKSIEQHMKKTASEGEIVQFKKQLAEVGSSQGWTLDELQNGFSNELWDDIINA
ncbi:MAG: hypothetical protein Q9206_002164 [Seirophora lacunosa]